MTTNGTNSTEDTEMGEYDGDKVVTMLDVLQEEQEFEEDANAVLGASDDKNCSYNKGYIRRQAIYACMSCCPDAKSDPLKRAGVCLACSLTCHENHELIELYTKRNFRCDCGNTKFNSRPCQLNPNKTDLNEDNKYNQNYSGLYCTCHRPYPDPESTMEDEMIQCIVCEDWLHASHLDAAVPDEPYSEMICKNCTEKNIFLHDYSNLVITSENVDVDISGSSTITLSNGGPEFKGTSEKTKDQDVEMKDEVDKDLTDGTPGGGASQTESKEESIINSQINAIDDCTNELEKDIKTQTKSNTTPKSDEEGKSNVKTVEVKIEDNYTNVVSEHSTHCNQNEIDCESNLDNKEDLSAKETVEVDLKDVNREESEEPTPQDTDVPTTHNNKSDSDVPLGDISESKDIDNDLKMEEELLKDPTDTEVQIGQQEQIETEIKISNAESGQEAVMDTPNEPLKHVTNDKVTDKTTKAIVDIDSKQTTDTVNEQAMDTPDKPTVDTTNEPVTVEECIPAIKTSLDAENGTEMDVGKKKENQSNNTEVQQIVLDNLDSSAANSKLQAMNTITEVDPKKLEKDGTKEEETNSITNQAVVKVSMENVEETVANSSSENKRKLSVVENTDDGAKRIKPNESKSCVRSKGIKRHLKGATFWPSNFRQKLCTCSECLSMYKDLSVLFLIDSEDTVAAYETLGKERSNGNSQYEKGLQALSSLDRIQQINAVTEYNKLREKLSDFLKSFMLKKEIVKEEDIKAFFAGMKPKREPDGVYFCR